MNRAKTIWQYVANFSSGVLIILLSVALITLFFINRKAAIANKELRTIKNVLELRVRERTASLEETSNLLRYSESYIRDILESMPIALIGLDKDLNINQWNRLSEEITGADNEQVMGKNLWDAYPTITLTPNQINQALSANSAVTIKHCQHGQYYYDLTIYPLREHKEMGLVILLDDVTQRTLAANILVQRDKMASMGELAANMAHDIDGPLQAILSDLQSVQGELKTQSNSDFQKVKVLLNDAAERGTQVMGIIANLLDFSRAQRDKKEDADIPEIMNHTIDLAKVILSESSGLKFSDIVVVQKIEANLPKFPSHVSELQQVFLSLFRSACHSLGEVDKVGFEPKISVEISDNYGALWIKAQHNGKGLTSEEQQYIFEPFFNTKNAVLGTGLGLASSHGIIERHSGWIEVKGGKDGGTTFEVYLPRSGRLVPE
ncbi:MAG: PAS domain-containing protein, partial [Pseudomonadales bacterium]|nr:PAS domain-containing protein [Pseudomonadales bacterium]